MSENVSTSLLILMVSLSLYSTFMLHLKKKKKCLVPFDSIEKAVKLLCLGCVSSHTTRKWFFNNNDKINQAGRMIRLLFIIIVL